MRDVKRRLEGLEAASARLEANDLERAEAVGCPEGLLPQERVDWWARLPHSQQRAVELRAMSNAEFYGFVDALAERYPKWAPRLTYGTQSRLV